MQENTIDYAEVLYWEIPNLWYLTGALKERTITRISQFNNGDCNIR